MGETARWKPRSKGCPGPGPAPFCQLRTKRKDLPCLSESRTFPDLAGGSVNRSSFSGSINPCRPTAKQPSKLDRAQTPGPAHLQAAEEPSPVLSPLAWCCGLPSLEASTCPKGRWWEVWGPMQVPRTAVNQQKLQSRLHLTALPRKSQTGFPGATTRAVISPDREQEAGLRPSMKVAQSIKWGPFSCPHLSPRKAYHGGRALRL